MRGPAPPPSAPKRPDHSVAEFTPAELARQQRWFAALLALPFVLLLLTALASLAAWS